MYLKNSLSGVCINKMYIPEHLADFAAKIINFVLESPGLDTDRAEFTIEKEGEKTMENQTQENITNEELQNACECEKCENCENCAEPQSIASLIMGNPAAKEMLNMLAIRSLIVKSLELEDRINDLETEVGFIKNQFLSPEFAKDSINSRFEKIENNIVEMQNRKCACHAELEDVSA